MVPGGPDETAEPNGAPPPAEPRKRDIIPATLFGNVPYIYTYRERERDVPNKSWRK